MGRPGWHWRHRRLPLYTRCLVEGNAPSSSREYYTVVKRNATACKLQLLDLTSYKMCDSRRPMHTLIHWGLKKETGHYLLDDIYKYVFWYESWCIDRIYIKSALVQVMFSCSVKNIRRAIAELRVTIFKDAYVRYRHQWVKNTWPWSLNRRNIDCFPAFFSI